MTTATLDSQDALDQEDAALFRKQIRRLAGDVRDRQADELAAKEDWRVFRKDRARADDALAALVEDDGTGPDADYLERLDRTCQAAEKAKEYEHEAHDKWVLAVVARRHAQDELRVAVRRRFAPAPLFDAAANQNGQEVYQVVQDLNREVQEVNQRACRVCGCTDADCSRCIAKTGLACHWVGADLCSACQVGPEHSMESAAWRDTPLTAMGLPPATVRQLHHWGLTTAGAASDALLNGKRIVGLNNEAHNGLIDRIDELEYPAGEFASASAAPAAEPEAVPNAWDWPAGLTDGVLEKSCITDALSKVSRKAPKAAKANPFEWEGRLWICVSMIEDLADVLPLIEADSFEELFPQYATGYYPDAAKLNLPMSHEDRKQWYTGVVVKVGRKEYAIAPAGEQRTICKKKETV